MRTKTFIEKYFEAPEWWFTYKLRSKVSSNINILGFLEKENGVVELDFGLRSRFSQCVPVDPEDPDWEQLSFSCNGRFEGTILCTEVKEIKYIDMSWGKDAKIRISKMFFSGNKKVQVFDAENNSPFLVIICKKLFIKDNDITMVENINPSSIWW